MKVLPFLFLLLCSGTFYSQNPEAKPNLTHRALYKLTYQPNKSDEGSKTSEIMHLYLGKQGSRFMSKGKDRRDTLVASTSLNTLSRRDYNADTETAFDYVIVKNRPDKEISYNLQILGDYLKYVQDLDQFDWQILPESKMINGYESQKARTEFAGREYVAWFTSEIPIPDGPYKFNGLPGLILEIKDIQDHYVFELLEFKELSSPVEVDSEEKFVETSRENVLRLKREFEEDPFRVLENNNTPQKTVTIHLDAKTKKKMLKKRQEELEKRNNPIELE